MSINTGNGTGVEVTLEELQKMTTTAASQKLPIRLNELSERVDEALRVLDAIHGRIDYNDYIDLHDAIIEIYPDNEGDEEVSQYVYEECPHCGYEIGLEWNVKEKGYQVYCPVCGRAVMLCGECQGGINGDQCGWNNETERCFRSTNVEEVERTKPESTWEGTCRFEKSVVRKSRTAPENGEKDESCCILNRDEATALWESVKHSYLKKWLVDENEERTLESLYHFIGGCMKVKAIAEVGGKV